MSRPLTAVPLVQRRLQQILLRILTSKHVLHRHNRRAPLLPCLFVQKVIVSPPPQKPMFHPCSRRAPLTKRILLMPELLQLLPFQAIPDETINKNLGISNSKGELWRRMSPIAKSIESRMFQFGARTFQRAGEQPHMRYRNNEEYES
jgi:hypothetical protein